MKQSNKISFVSNPDIHSALIRWWQELDNMRGERAELRRCHNPMEVVFNPAFHRLRWNLNNLDKGYINPQWLATVAGVLSHVKKFDAHANFAAQMATLKAGSNNVAVSELRFRRLLKIEHHDELFGALIRIVHLLDGNVNISSLANGAYWWNEFTRKDWAYSYYDKAPGEN